MKILDRICFISFSVLLLLFFITPFHIHANSNSLPKPFIGVNYSVSQVDSEHDQDIYFNGLNGTRVQGSIAPADIKGNNLACVTMTNQNPNSSSSGSSPNANADYECTRYESVGTGSISRHSFYFDFNNDIFTSFLFDTFQRIYDIDFILDNIYIGSFTYTLTFNDDTSYTDTLYVNGSIANIHYRIGTGDPVIKSVSVSNVSLILNKYHDWNFPIESFNVVYYAINNLDQIGFNSFNDYQYPIFSVQSNTDIFHSNKNNSNIFILATNRNIYNADRFNTFFSLSDGEVTNVESLKVWLDQNNNYWNLAKITISNYSSGGILTITSKNTLQYMPIYWASDTFKSISTDFALQYNLSNDFLKNIDLLANGNNNSNNSSNQLNDSNNQFNQDSNQLMGIEDQYNDDFNNQLDNVDFSNPVNSSPNFLSSAKYTIRIFNNIVNNTPLKSIILVFCIVYIGLKVFGK